MFGPDEGHPGRDDWIAHSKRCHLITAVLIASLKGRPARYKIIVRRVQTAERHVRAADEEAAAQKIQAELDRPYGFLGALAVHRHRSRSEIAACYTARPH